MAWEAPLFAPLAVEPHLYREGQEFPCNNNRQHAPGGTTAANCGGREFPVSIPKDCSG